MGYPLPARPDEYLLSKARIVSTTGSLRAFSILLALGLLLALNAKAQSCGQVLSINVVPTTLINDTNPAFLFQPPPGNGPPFPAVGIVTVVAQGCAADIESGVDVRVKSLVSSDPSQDLVLGDAQVSSDHPDTVTFALENPQFLVSTPTQLTIVANYITFGQIVSSVSTTFTVLPFNPTFSITPSQLQGGSPGAFVQGTMVLDVPARGNDFFDLVVSIHGAAAGDSFEVTSSSGSSCSVPSQTFCSLLWATPTDGQQTFTFQIAASIQSTQPETVSVTANWGGGSRTAQFQLIPAPDQGPCNECEGNAGAPINLGTGDVWVTKTDYSVPGLAGGLSITRTWNSLWQVSSPVFQSGMFGQGWISNLEERLQVQDSSHIKYWRGDGNVWIFLQNSPGTSPGATYSVQLPGEAHASLLYDSTSMLYTLVFADGSRKTFDNNGFLLSWADRNGNTTTLSYDSVQRIIQVTSAGGQSVTFAYSNSQFPGLVTTTQDSVGVIANYTFAAGLLSQVTYSDASVLQYSYDGSNNITAVTDAQGKIIETHTYDAQGRGLTSSSANGVNAITVQYSSNGGPTTLTDSKGNTTANFFTKAGGRNRISFVNGASCNTCGALPFGSYDYDQFGNRRDWFDGNGNDDVSYTYDSQGNVISRDEFVQLNGSPQDINYSYTYNNFGEALTVTDPLGNVTTNTYDADGDPLTITTPSPGGNVPGTTTTLTYDGKGQLLTVQDPRGNVTAMAYTPAGLVSSITDAQGHVTSFQYDARGNRTSVTDPASQTTGFTFDSMNRVTKITNPDSSTTQFTYDTRGRRTSVTNGNSKTTTYAYDDADRLNSVTDASGHATAYAYDTENNLTSLTDAAGHTTSFAYDANRRLTQTTFPSSLTETYSYDADGNLLSKTDRKGNAINYTYDQLSRLIQKSYPDSTSVSYTYDLASHLTQVSDASGTYNFTYDGLGRLTQSATQYAFLTGQTLTNAYGYDADSNRVSLTNPQGGVTNYAYDSLNRVTNLTDFAGHSFNFSYDAIGRRTGLTRPNGVNTSYSYDSLSRLLTVTHQGASGALDGAAYAYDSAGNRTSRTPLPTNVTTNYTYDPTDQLLTAKVGSTTKESYTYDAVGNRTYQPGAHYTYNSSNEMTAREGVPYTYDSNGNTLSKTNGSGATSYVWDFENRLTRVTPPIGSGISFTYDPFGRRIRKTSPVGTTIYVYDRDNIIEDLDASGNVVERYTYGPGIDEPLVGQRNPKIFFYEADGLGSVTSLTDPTGGVAATYTYDSFGFLTNSTGSATNWLRYTARQFDSDTALYYYRARYYDPTYGRFLSEDPIGFQSGTNFYTYVRNNPVLFVDPTGNCLDINIFVAWLDKHATSEYIKGVNGHCAHNIREALKAGGLNTNGNPINAKDYGPFLQNLGFSLVSQTNYSPQLGDVVVIQPGSPSGHIQAWDGTQWVSDFKQGSKKISPYGGDTPQYAIYRFAQPCP